MTSSNLIKHKVKAYYEATIDDYDFFWSANKNFAIHYGFTDTTTHTFSEVLVNENKFLARIASINSSDVILDAGCGFGGSSLWLAQQYKAKVIGVSINPTHIARARKYASELGLSSLVKFYQMDYHALKFPRNTFSVIWAIESLCHSTDKNRLLKELYRVLKPGGRLIVADGYQNRLARTRGEQELFDAFINGLGVFKTTYWNEFKDSLTANGFINIRRWNVTNKIVPSSRKIYRMSIITFPIWYTLWQLGFISDIRKDNVVAGRLQWLALKKKLWLYGIYYARKSKA